VAPDDELRRHLDSRDLESAVSEVYLSEGAFSVGLTFDSLVAAIECAATRQGSVRARQGGSF
jgi:hypothetical protein